MGMKQTIGLIGAGNMGTAILEGLFSKQTAQPGQVIVYDKLEDKAREFSQKWKCQLASSNQALAKKSQIILLAVKPQDLASTSQEIRADLSHRPYIISILAGTPIQKIREILDPKLDIIRAMPNLGAKVGQSLTALAGFSSEGMELAENIFKSCGQTIQLGEDLFDLITALSGSGPAYFFYLMELMAKEGVSRGLSEDQAKKVAIQTALGSALLAAESSESPAVLRERVTSKGGTTEAALKELTKTFPETFQKGIEAAYQRGKELSK